MLTSSNSTAPSGLPTEQSSGQPSGQSSQPSTQPSSQPSAPTPEPTEEPKWHLSETEAIGLGFGVFFGAGVLLAVGHHCAKKCNEH